MQNEDREGEKARKEESRPTERKQCGPIDRMFLQCITSELRVRGWRLLSYRSKSKCSSLKKKKKNRKQLH